VPASVPVPVQRDQDRWAWMSTPSPAVVAGPAAPAVSGAEVAAPPALDDYFSGGHPAPSGWPTPTRAPAPSPTAGVPLVLAGVALIAVALVSFIVRWTPLGDARVELPSQVLGMPKDEAASDMAQGALDGLAAHVPGGMPDDMQLAVYGTPPAALLVIAADEGSRAPEAELSSMPTGMAAQLVLDGGTDVDAGERGGAARCWTGQQEGRPLVVCGFVDRETMVMVMDYTGNDLATSSQAALAVRDAVVS
jgi:hypothetical protein